MPGRRRSRRLAVPSTSPSSSGLGLCPFKAATRVRIPLGIFASSRVNIPSMYIARIRLENIRGFRELEIDLSGQDGSPRKRTVIIGKNGTCKTSVLRAIALGLCDFGDANALISEPIGSMIFKDSRVGQIRIELDSGKQRLHNFLVPNRATDQERVSRVSELDWPKTFACGYGAGRHGFGSDTGRDYRVADAVYTLFDYRRTLIDPELTLRRLQDLL